MPKETLAPKTPLELPKPHKSSPNLWTRVRSFGPLRAMGDWTKEGTTGHHSATRTGLGGAPPPEEAGREISRPTDSGRTGIWLEKMTASASVCRRNFRFFDHFKPPHSSFTPFLDPLNSFPWSLFADSSPFESYDKNKVGRRLDQVFRPPQ